MLQIGLLIVWIFRLGMLSGALGGFLDLCTTIKSINFANSLMFFQLGSDSSRSFPIIQ